MSKNFNTSYTLEIFDWNTWLSSKVCGSDNLKNVIDNLIQNTDFTQTYYDIFISRIYNQNQTSSAIYGDALYIYLIPKGHNRNWFSFYGVTSGSSNSFGYEYSFTSNTSAAASGKYFWLDITACSAVSTNLTSLNSWNALITALTTGVVSSATDASMAGFSDSTQLWTMPYPSGEMQYFNNITFTDEDSFTISNTNYFYYASEKLSYSYASTSGTRRYKNIIIDNKTYTYEDTLPSYYDLYYVPPTPPEPPTPTGDPTIADYLNSLITDKENLVSDLQSKGMPASDSETFSELVPKVATIPSAYAPKYITMENHPGPDADFYADLAGLNTSAVKQISGISFNANQSSYYPSSGVTIDMETPELVSTACMFSTPLSPSDTTSNTNKLVSLTLNHLDTGKVSDMRKMFCGCGQLTSLDVSCFTTNPGVDVDATCLFQNCGGCTSITLGNWSPSISNAYHMFSSCSNITSIDLSKFSFTNCTSVEGMFSNCSKLTTITGLDKVFNNKATKYSNMFASCPITSIDVSSATPTVPIKAMSSMFDQCVSLASVKLPAITADGNCTFYQMFYNCKNITSIDLSNWDTFNASNYSRMFMWCTGLESADLSSFTVRTGGTFSSVQNMFHQCTSLKHLDLRSWKFTSIPAAASLPQMFGNSNNTPTIPLDCEIIVKDSSEKDALLAVYPTLTNVKTVAEYEA